MLGLRREGIVLFEGGMKASSGVLACGGELILNEYLTAGIVYGFHGWKARVLKAASGG